MLPSFILKEKVVVDFLINQSSKLNQDSKLLITKKYFNGFLQLSRFCFAFAFFADKVDVGEAGMSYNHVSTFHTQHFLLYHEHSIIKSYKKVLWI